MDEVIRCPVCDAIADPEQMPEHMLAHADCYPVDSVPWQKLQRFAAEWEELLARVRACPDCK